MNNMITAFRYHGDERLLPEYNPSMSDNVKVVEDDLSSLASHPRNEAADPASTFFPDYHFVEESHRGRAEEQESKPRSMYLATLKLNKVRPEQKGVYKCGPSNTRSASVELHITDGNRTDADRQANIVPAWHNAG